ncbi:MAG TPA: restriction endonuclease [Anaeromyxobacter sp.]|nr:restriction endonuclease [Anaeromyxobacter sp.]
MSLLLLAAVATAAGVIAALLVGSGRRARGPGPRGEPAAAGTDLGFLRARGAAGLERLLVALLGELGFTSERTDRGARTVDVYALDPTPIRGGRAYVRGVLAEPGEAVSGDDVRAALDLARAEAIGKVLLVTDGRFSAEAREAARDQPIELLDGDALAALVRRHLPQVWATRTV